jgi:ketosteroid isomerase-like protein
MRTVIVSIAAVAAVLAACAPQTPTVDIAAETEALRETAASYNEAVESMDGARVAVFYADDAQAMPPNGPTLSGPAEFQAFVEEFSAGGDISLSLDPVEAVVGAGGDLGYTVGMVRITAAGPDGEPVTVEERDVHVWRKEADGSWKLVVDIWNSPTPLPEEAAAEAAE